MLHVLFKQNDFYVIFHALHIIKRNAHIVNKRNARNAAIEAKKVIVVDKKNPNEEKKKIKQEITFGKMFNEFMERYSKKHKRSWKYDEREVNKFLKHWFIVKK